MHGSLAAPVDDSRAPHTLLCVQRMLSAADSVLAATPDRFDTASCTSATCKKATHTASWRRVRWHGRHCCRRGRGFSLSSDSATQISSKDSVPLGAGSIGQSSVG
ncbi:hypothetical protein MTO96_000293 [Rhipicephalus appendiculatus]